MPQFNDDVLVLGDGPAGLTAALFLAKNGVGVHVLGQDKTPMHKALLNNQPGVPGMTGTEFMRTLREQVINYGAHLHTQAVVEVRREGDAFEARTEDGNLFRGRYLVLATGRQRSFADTLGLAGGETGVVIDLHGRTSVPNVYAGGGLARGITQVAISTGDGASIALDILQKETGKKYDYDHAPAPKQAPGTTA